MARLPKTPRGLASRIADSVLAEKLAAYGLAPEDLPESVDIRELGKLHIPIGSLTKALAESNFVRNQAMAMAQKDGLDATAEYFAEYL